MDKNNRPVTISFDLVKGSSPLVLGLDVTQFSDIVNRSKDTYIAIRRPQDEQTYIFDTYITRESNSPKCARQRISLFSDNSDHLPLQPAMIGSIVTQAQRDPRSFAKRIHRYTHAHPDQLKYLCDRAGLLKPEVKRAIEDTSNACSICVRSGRPLPSKKVSLTHVNEAFNEEVQVDFTFMTITANQTNLDQIRNGTKLILLVFRDTGTGYTEAEIVDTRNIDTIITTYDQAWLSRHGASKRVSADDEYNRAKLTKYFSAHDIEYKPRPTRRHNKTGLVERKHGVLKDILRRLILEKSSESIRTVVARAVFLSNLFRGSKVLSSFELARGYQPSVAGIPATKTTQPLMNAHTEQTAARALQRVLHSHTPNIPTPDMFEQGDEVWVWYASTKSNEPNEWIPAQVVKPHSHFLEVRRIKNGQPCRGPTMRPAYEDIRMAPKGDLAKSLLELSLEEEMAYEDTAEEKGARRTSKDTPEPPPLIPSLLSQANPQKGVHEDIGAFATLVDEDPPSPLPTEPVTLSTDKERIIEDIYENVGSQQVSRGKLDCAPPWVLDQAFDKELTSNWMDAIEVVDEKSVPHNANVISSHCVYKVKTQEDGKRDLKSRLVPHGNRDDEKDNLRKDSANAQLGIIRLLLSITTFMGFRLATADIKGAYLQSGPIKREIFVRPPPEWRAHPTYQRYTLWRLLKLPYGIVEAGRQWLLTVENWMLDSYGLERAFGISQMFLKRDAEQNILLMVAKVTDDFLISGKIQAMKDFIDKLRQRFEVGKFMINERFHFNGCEIEQSPEGHIRMSMNRYLDRIRPITISRSRKKENKDKVTPQELKQYRALAGTLLYLGNGVMPQASFVVSVMQQRTGYLTVQHLSDANEMVKELLNLRPWVAFPKPTGVTKISYCTFSDASHPRDRDYGQTGIVAGFKIETTDTSRVLFHPIDWTSQKQHRVSYSSYGAEILAAAYGDDRGFYYKTAMNTLFPHINVIHELNVDSKALFDTISTLHESTEYRLRPTVQRIRNSFESQELDVLRWIPGKLNVADALTKRSKELYEILNDLCSYGLLNINLSAGRDVASETWL